MEKTKAISSAKELDLNCLLLVRTTQELHEKKTQLQKLIADGYLCLSKARYVMGAERISSLHYNSVMRADSTVDVAMDKHCATFIVTHKHEKKSKISSAVEKSQDGLKHRISHSQKNKEEIENTGESDAVKSLDTGLEKLSVEDDENDTEGNMFINPLNWFGILVPQSLRQSQLHFKKAVTFIGEICTLQSQLMSAEKRHRQLVQSSDIKNIN